MIYLGVDTTRGPAGLTDQHRGVAATSGRSGQCQLGIRHLRALEYQSVNKPPFFQGRKKFETLELSMRERESLMFTFYI